MKPNSKRITIFRYITLAVLAGLVLEFILGMVTALYVQFPDTLAGNNAWPWAMKASPVVMAHVIIGTILLLLAIGALIYGLASRDKTAAYGGVAGLALTLLAYLSGSSFLANTVDDTFSFLMALGFIGSLTAYATVFYLTRRK